MRLIVLAAVTALILGLGVSSFAQGPAPISMTNAALGGGRLNQYTGGVENGVGVNNIGLLVQTWGRVTYSDTTGKFFYIDDGSGRKDGSTHLVAGLPVENVGVRVSYDSLAAGNSITAPALTTFVTVAGICSTVVIDGKVQPNLRPRRQADLVP